MQSSRLKTIVILILLLVNGFLLASLLHRKAQEAAAHQLATEQLIALFAADGVTLDADIIPSEDAPPTFTLTRDPEMDRDLASFFLGNVLVQSDLGGGKHTYVSGAGDAQFRSNGNFAVAVTSPPSGTPQEIVEEFCDAYGYQLLSLSLNSGTGSAVVMQTYKGYPVIRCNVTFSFENNKLQRVTGVHLPESGEESDGGETLSAAGALTRFLESRRETGAVFSAVTDIFPCYELQSTTAVPMSLVPAWYIVTDAANYYVNCSTGNVTHG